MLRKIFAKIRARFKTYSEYPDFIFEDCDGDLDPKLKKRVKELYAEVLAKTPRKDI